MPTGPTTMLSTGLPGMLWRTGSPCNLPGRPLSLCVVHVLLDRDRVCFDYQALHIYRHYPVHIYHI